MNLQGKVITTLYAALPLLFICVNLQRADPSIPASSRWPEFTLTSQSIDSSQPHPVPVLDLTRVKQSINRLPSVTWLRQAGNSLRLFAGQSLSWAIWGNGNPPMLYHSVELWVSEGPAVPEFRQRIDDAAATVVKYHDILQREGWTMVVVPVPTKLSIYRDQVDWPIWEKDPLSRQPVEQDEGDRTYDRLLTQLQQHDISVVDLRAVYRHYRESHPDAALLYPAAETHWSGLGLKLAADATARQISEMTGIPRREIDPGYLEVEEVADIAAGFDPLPAWTNRLDGLYRYQDRLVNGDRKKGFIYPANPTSLMVVVGTSYSGQFTWHIGQPVGFAWALGGQLVECEFHNGAEAGHGSFAAFARFLAERDQKIADFSQRRALTEFPKVVVWEFPVRDLASLVGQ